MFFEKSFLLLSAMSFVVAWSHSIPDKKKLIYIMIDGFRDDYVDMQPPQALPGFNRLLKGGVHAEYMTAIYPSVSYPDWTTLVTGLYPESHGIVGNSMYDAETGDIFGLYQVEQTGRKKWWPAEPIWTTASKENVKTAVILWSRCDVPFDGVTPEYCENFVSIKGTEIIMKNADKVLQKLEEGYDFIQWYTEHTDNVGHKYGPESEEVKEAVRAYDTMISYLLDKIEEKQMTDNVNIIIVSDHGMTSAKPGDMRRVELDDYLLRQHVQKSIDHGPSCNIKVKEGHVDEVYAKLKTMPGVSVYRKNDIPEELHIKKGKYILDIVIKADIDTLIMGSEHPTHFPKRNPNADLLLGHHGYDPQEKAMRTIFYAIGPDFKQGTRIPAIKNVDVYPLLASLLGVNPRPNNGSLEATETALNAATQKLKNPFIYVVAFVIININVYSHN